MGSGGSILYVFSLPHQTQVQVNKNFIKTEKKKKVMKNFAHLRVPLSC